MFWLLDYVSDLWVGKSYVNQPYCVFGVFDDPDRRKDGFCNQQNWNES